MDTEYYNGAKPTDEIKVTFHVKQNGRVVVKELLITRENFIKYNAIPRDRHAELYERIVKEKAFIKITDLGYNN